MAFPHSLGKYRLLKRIARGGMGEVWSAEPIDTPGMKVAVKTLLSPEDADTMSLAKFIGEARIGAAVSDHPNIVRTVDLGLEGERMFIVMELLEGRPLSQLIRTGPMAVEGAVGIALPVLAALEHAQKAVGPTGETLQLVHRDLKPGNLFITREGVVKVIDFGIALASGMDQTTTRTGLIRGSIAYVSPEQARGERSDGRSDVYSLAVVLHELLTGKRLFDQQNDAARLSAILFGEVPKVRPAREVPLALEEAVMWALQRDPSKRPADAATFAAALKKGIGPAEPWGSAQLAQWLASRQVATPASQSAATGPIAVGDASPKRPVPVPSLELGMAAATEHGEPDLPEPERSRVPLVVLAVGATLVLSLGVLAARLTGVEPGPGPTPPRPIAVAKAAEPAQIPAPALAAVVQPEPEPAPVAEPPPAVPEAAKPAPAPVQVKPAVRKPKPVESNAAVHVTIDSRPTWANVSVDGKDLGPTPLVRVPLPVSSRVLTAVNADGKRRSVKLKLVEGKDEKVLLEW